MSTEVLENQLHDVALEQSKGGCKTNIDVPWNFWMWFYVYIMDHVFFVPNVDV